MNTPKKIFDDKLLKLKDVLKKLPISKSAWHEGVKQKRLPQPVRLGIRSVAWLESDIEDYLQKNYGGPCKPV
jgi:prophage regulatory protein